MKKIKIGKITELEFKRVSIYLQQDWSNILKPKQYNWNIFNLFKIYLENDAMFSNFELEVYVLGLGVRVVYTYNTVANKKKREEIFKKYGVCE